MKVKSRKIVSALLTLAMVFSLFAAMPLTAQADTPPGPQDVCVIVNGGGVGVNVGYANLADALAAAPNIWTGAANPTVIRLLGNVTHSNPVHIDGKIITFDLNGYDLIIRTDASTPDPSLELSGYSEVDYTGTGEFKVIKSIGPSFGNYDGDLSALSVRFSSCELTGVEYTDYRPRGTGQGVNGISCVNSDVVVNGDVKVQGNNSNSDVGVSTSVEWNYGMFTSANVTITGNIISDGLGVRVRGGSGAPGGVTVDGTITAPMYIEVSGQIKTIADFTTPTRKPGYFTYMYEAPPGGLNFSGLPAVCVKDPSPPVAPVITSANNYSCVTGTSGSHSLTATGTAAVTTWSLTGAPDGVLIIDGSTLWVAASVPAGTYNFTITASNGTLPDATQNFTITVAPLPYITEVTIDGTPEVGKTLTTNVSYSGNVSGAPYVTYQWQRSFSPNYTIGGLTNILPREGGTSSSYKLTTADRFKYIRVVVTGMGSNVQAGTVCSDWMYCSPFIPHILTFAYDPAFDIPESTVGTPIRSLTNIAAGVSGGIKPYTFTADGLPPGLVLNNPSVTLQGMCIIFGTPTTAMPAGTAIITVTDGQGQTASITINYGAVSAAPLLPYISEVAIDGTPEVGNTLTANVSYSGSVSGTPDITYQWQQRSSTFNKWRTIAASSSYELMSADEGLNFRVLVTGNGTNVQATTVTSDSVTCLAGLPYITEVAIDGTPEVGNKLIANVSYSGNVSGAPDVTYQWQCSSPLLKWRTIATSSSYELTPAAEGLNFRVLVTGNGTNVQATTVISDSVTCLTGLPYITEVYIKGDVEEGETLVSFVTYSDPNIINPKVNYEWQYITNERGAIWQSIPGADLATYMVEAAYADSAIRLMVSGTGTNIDENAVISNVLN